MPEGKYQAGWVTAEDGASDLSHDQRNSLLRNTRSPKRVASPFSPTVLSLPAQSYGPAHERRHFPRLSSIYFARFSKIKKPAYLIHSSDHHM